MRVVLLANGWVGLEVARYLRSEDPPVGLVLHEAGNSSLSDEIAAVSGLDQDDIIASERLHEPVALARLKEWAPDILVSAWYDSILRPEVLAVPSMGCVNLHPSCLPYGRGKFPNVWNSFRGLGDVTSIVANCATEPHTKEFTEAVDPLADSFIPYDWRIAGDE